MSELSREAIAENVRRTFHLIADKMVPVDMFCDSLLASAMKALDATNDPSVPVDEINRRLDKVVAMLPTAKKLIDVINEAKEKQWEQQNPTA